MDSLSLGKFPNKTLQYSVSFNESVYRINLVLKIPNRMYHEGALVQSIVKMGVFELWTLQFPDFTDGTLS